MSIPDDITNRFFSSLLGREPAVPDDSVPQRKIARTRVDGSEEATLPCLDGDIAVHLHWPAPDATEPQVVDLWRLLNGDRLTITTRAAALADGFPLHHTESTADTAPSPAQTPAFAPNVWRLRAGDTLVFVRPDADPRLPAAFCFDCVISAVAILDTTASANPADLFRAPPAGAPSPDAAARLRLAYNSVRRAGAPACWTETWTLQH